MARRLLCNAAPVFPERMRRHRPCPTRSPFSCEFLESRLLLLGNALLTTDLGILAPGRFFSGSEIIATGGSTVAGHFYTFTLDDPAAIDLVVLLHAPPFGQVPGGFVSFFPEGSSDSFVTVNTSSSGRARITQTLQAGSYEIEVGTSSSSDVTFDFSLNDDLGPGAFAFANSTADFTASPNKSLGTLTMNGTNGADDFVGYLRTSNDAALDAVDIYTFSVPLAGSVNVSLSQLLSDQAGGAVSVNVGLYSDFDHDGLFKANELLASRTGLSNSASFNASINAGTYAVVVSSTIATAATGIIGGSNYRLLLTYTPPDNAGNTLASARNLGTLGSSPQSFTDYLSNADPSDVYRFSILPGGPFLFQATVTGTPGAPVTYDLIRDANSNNAVDAGEIVGSVDGQGSLAVSLSALLTLPGTYFVRARRSSGEGRYTLTVSSTNTDHAGNTLATATNIGNLLGKTHFIDFVSASDNDDFYKFTLLNDATLHVNSLATADGTDANLALIQDVNGNGVVDKTDVLVRTSVVGNGAEAILRGMDAGTYFLDVFQVTGSPSYDVSISADAAASTTPGALPMTFVNGRADTIEYVGPEDTVDLYRVIVTAPLQLNAFMSLFGEPLTVSIARDANNDTLISNSEAITRQTLSTGSGRVSANLSTAGTYYVSVTGGPNGTNYGIVLATAPVDSAGNSLADARVVAPGTAVQSFSDLVGTFGSISATDDLDDFYRFTPGTNGPYQFIAQAPVVNGLVAMQLIYDANNNAQIDSGEILGTVASPGINQSTPPLVALLTLPGNYYVHVFANSAAYVLNLQAISLDTAGNTLATARALTTASVSEFAGRIDPDDFYSFTAAGPGELRAQLTGSNPLISVEIIRDNNKNGVVDPGEILGSTAGYPIDNDVLDGLVLPAAGTYFAHVQANGVESNYSLTLTQSAQFPFNGAFQIGPDAPTLIQAEDFDSGGEGVAYHDTTPASNAGNQYRPAEGVDIFRTSDSGGGFRVDNSDAGEFLEYTLNVSTTGSYDFDFRAGATGTGARFHAEIDGVDISGPRDVPGQLPADTFATVTAANVQLTAGPHLLRFVFDKASSSGAANAGALNFILIRPSTGTFVLTPADPVASPGKSTTLALAWTVPAGDWHVLRTIDIRLRGDDGSLIWLRFDEARQTLALYNSHSHKFGPAKKIGSHDHLSDGLVDIDLAGSSVVAAGPTSPVVTLTLSLIFDRSIAGETFGIEVAATNDAGFVQAFERAGTLQILGHSHGDHDGDGHGGGHDDGHGHDGSDRDDRPGPPGHGRN